MHALQPRITVHPTLKRWPAGRLILGIVLLGASWGISWFGPADLGEHTFFFLWLGYILLADAVVQGRSGSSLWSRHRVAFLLLFILSAPLWWLFEAANIRLQNWHYHLRGDLSWLHYRAESSLAFSTVLPALFETTELILTTRLSRRPFRGKVFTLPRRRLYAVSLFGAGMILAVMLFPRHLFPFIWIGGFLLLDPVNALGGRRSLLRSASRGQYAPVIVLALSGIACGFLWEMWNIRAMPKWTYEIPYFDWIHLFEMPILGYGGYIPFAFELYAAYHLISAVLPAWGTASFAIDQCGSDSRETTQS